MRLKLTGKHSSHVGKRRVGAACLTLCCKRRPSLLHDCEVREGAVLNMEDNEELHSVRLRDTQVLSIEL